MNREITYSGKTIKYTLEIKNVKNVNMRIKPDGIYVSANRFVSLGFIDKFVQSKADFILNAQMKIAERRERQFPPAKEYFTEKELYGEIMSLCEKYYNYFSEACGSYPRIRFRKMKSRWGSCIPSKCAMTFNTLLRFAPQQCVEYVVIHEYTHFLQPNHSSAFYSELEKLCPNYRTIQNWLKLIKIN